MSTAAAKALRRRQCGSHGGLGRAWRAPLPRARPVLRRLQCASSSSPSVSASRLSGVRLPLLRGARREPRADRAAAGGSPTGSTPVSQSTGLRPLPPTRPPTTPPALSVLRGSPPRGNPDGRQCVSAARNTAFGDRHGPYSTTPRRPLPAAGPTESTIALRSMSWGEVESREVLARRVEGVKSSRAIAL